MTSAALRAHAGEESRSARARRLALPLLVGGGAIGGAVVSQLLFDPYRQDVPLCLWHALTGGYCPGCGMTRAVHALLAGDLPLALHNNVFVVVLVPAVVVVWWRWLRRRWRGEPPPPPPPWTRGRRALVAALVVALVLFTVARNLPAFAVLAPTSLIGA